MSKTITTTLEKICLQEKGAIISGPFGSNISSRFFVTEGIPVIRGNNLSLSYDKFYDSGFVFVTKEKADELKCYAYRDDLIFTAAGTIGQVGIIPRNSLYEEYVISNKQIRARIDTRKVDLLYAYYWFSSPWIREILLRSNKGSTVPLLTLNEVKELPIVYPESLSEQRKIANCIELISSKIEVNRKINDNLQHQLKLLYDYWFTQFDFPDENGKPYRASCGAMVWNEQLKCEIPQNWKVSNVSDCVDKISTGLNPRDNFVLGNGDIRYITVKNLTATGSLDFSGCDTIDEDARAIVHRRSDISAGDILFASIAPLGRCYLIQQDPVDWDINESVFSIRSKTDTVTPEFMYLYFQSESFIQKATNTSTGSIFKGIRINTLLDTALIVPEFQVCKSFTNAVKPLLADINNNSSETAKLTALRDWLLPMLMNGQATITD